MRLQPLPEFEPFGQPVIARDKGALCRRGDRARARRQRRHRRGRARRYRGRHRAAAGGRRPPRLGAERIAAVRGPAAPTSPSSSTRVRGDAAAAFEDAPYVRRESFAHRAAHGAADGAARPAGGMGCRARATHRVRRRQGAVLQPPHAREADGSRRRRDRDGGERRRRRLRRARRVLSGGFPDPVRGAPHRPAR